MPNPLISPQLIVRMRSIANRALQTRVTLLRRLPVEQGEGLYGDDIEEWATIGDFDGWMKQPRLTPTEIAAGGIISAVGDYRLHLKSNVEVFIGDLIVAGDELFHVQDTNNEDTYRVFTTCLLRRRQ